jgi:hypothetical protein
MKNILTIVSILVFGVFLTAGNLLANDITIPDKMGSGTGWNGAQEDQEVEPGCVGEQKWDLEAFYLDGNSLTMIGGYDFKNGATGNGLLFSSGDIFIDVTGDVKYGPDADTTGYSNSTVKNKFGYDYVLDMDFDKATYKIYSLNGESNVLTSYYSINQESNPWRYKCGGTELGSGSIAYDTLNDGQIYDNYGLILAGLSHNTVGVDLGFLPKGTDFTVHFTMGCGNDNLMGKGTTSVPEPAPMLLLGTGLIGLAGVCRKKFIKK